MKTENNNQHKYVKFIEELYRAFDFFNSYFAAGQLVRPVLLVAPAGNKQMAGWYADKTWKDFKTKDEMNEINICADFLSCPPEEVLEVLLHEMAHLKNAQDGVFDCSKTQYHNKSFKTTAELFGLKVEKMQHKGWAKTSLDAKAQEAIAALDPKKELYQIVFKPKKKKADDRYIPLIVNRNETMEKLLENLTEVEGGKKNGVTEALWSYYNKLVKKGKVEELEREEEEVEA